MSFPPKPFRSAAPKKACPLRRAGPRPRSEDRSFADPNAARSIRALDPRARSALDPVLEEPLGRARVPRHQAGHRDPGAGSGGAAPRLWEEGRARGGWKEGAPPPPPPTQKKRKKGNTDMELQSQNQKLCVNTFATMERYIKNPPDCGARPRQKVYLQS